MAHIGANKRQRETLPEGACGKTCVLTIIGQFCPQVNALGHTLAPIVMCRERYANTLAHRSLLMVTAPTTEAEVGLATARYALRQQPLQAEHNT